MEKYLKINEVAKLLCTTPDAIRLYERKKLVHPARDQNNKYRGFTQEDITRLYDCKLLQNVGFSLSEIADIIYNTSPEEFDQLLEKKANEIEQKLVHYNRVLDQMHRLQAASYLHEYYEGEFYIRDSPHVLVCCYASAGELNHRSLEGQFYRHVIEEHNMFRRCIVVPQANAHSDAVGMDAMPGYSIEIEKAEELGIKADDVVMDREKQRSVYTVISVKDKLQREDLQPAYDWMEAHNFTLNGDILAWVLKLVYDHEEVTRLYAVWLPVK
ncbi:MAG: MerR family transcriptional regulator [Oscillospiraceae bacterium]|nr:MerR family transcriptional regulator [Oscillospiraceae bacterium]